MSNPVTHRRVYFAEIVNDSDHHTGTIRFRVIEEASSVVVTGGNTVYDNTFDRCNSDDAETVVTCETQMVADLEGALQVYTPPCYPT